MTPLDKKPSEELYRIHLTGQFIPQNINPYFFEENNLMGKNEAKSVKVVEASENEIIYGTDLFLIEINPNEIKVSTEQFLSFDLVKDFASGMAKLLSNSLNNHYAMSLRWHFSFDTKKQYQKVLNHFSNQDIQKELLPNIETSGIQLRQQNGELARLINIFPCARPDMKHTIHLYMSNVFDVEKSKNIGFNIESDNTTINESFEVANKLINAYF